MKAQTMIPVGPEFLMFPVRYMSKELSTVTAILIVSELSFRLVLTSLMVFGSPGAQAELGE